jgi:N-methylhydantoinase B
VPDSGGPGRWRGGQGLEMEFQLFAPQSMVTARNRDRSVFSAWGLRGGRAGRASRFVKNPGTDAAVELGSTDIVNCDPGDVILIQGPAAGGYGDPLERPVEAVLDDIRKGFVSIESARADYGVVLDAQGGADAAATARVRGEEKRRRPAGEFGHGPGRVAFEAVWTLSRYDALTRILATVPTTWRFFVKHRVIAAIGGAVAPADGGAADVVAAYDQLTAKFTDLPATPADLRAAVAAAAAE